MLTLLPRPWWGRGLTRRDREISVVTLVTTLSLLNCLGSLALAAPPSPLHKESESTSQLNTKSPPGLEAWRDWIQPQVSDLKCAERSGERACAWTSHLHVDLEDHSAELSYRVTMDTPGMIPILGGDQVAIQSLSISVKGETRPAPVIWRAERAWVQLPQGAALVKAHLTWSQSPDFLFVPSQVAHVTLKEAGQEVRWVERDQRGAIWLEAGKSAKPAQPNQEANQDRTNVQIFRIWRDQIPLKVETIVQLNISGEPRELILRGLKLAGSTLIQLKTSLNADWVEDGLRLYLKPGKAEVRLEEVLSQAPTSVRVPRVQGGDAEADEIWVWHSDEQLRSVKLSGLDEVDPDRTSLPLGLKGGTHTWIAPAGGELKIEELKRGVQTRPANDLQLSRTLWLDLDGEGIVSRDHITGKLRASNRLNVLTEGTIGRAMLGEGRSAQPLLITRDAHSGKEGVELRVDELNLYVDGREPLANREVKANDWAEQMNSLHLTLNLPPGWELFAVEGASECQTAWLNSWDMIEVFFLALISIGFIQLFGWRWGLLTLITLTLYHGDEGPSPLIWLFLLTSIVLMRVAYQAERFENFTLVIFTGGALIFASVVISQCHQDFRSALHPQLHRQGLSRHISSSNFQAEFAYEDQRSSRGPSSWSKSKRIPKKDYIDRKVLLRRQLQQLDQNAIVQTGPGLPTWSHSKHLLSFDAPIESGRSLRLYLIPPLGNRARLATRSIALLVLLVMMLRSAKRTLTTSSRKWSALLLQKSALPSLLLLITGGLVGSSQRAFAEEPLIPQSPLPQLSQTSDPIEPQVQAQAIQSNSNVKAQVEPSSSHPSQRGRLLGAWAPPKELLDEWVSRIRQAQSCQGECLYLGAMGLTLKGDEIKLTVRAHAERDSFFALPGGLSVIHWDQALIARQALPMRLKAHGSDFIVQVRVPQGTHDITARGRIADLTQINLSLSDLPHQLSLSLDGWSEEGVRGDQVAAMIRLNRVDPKRSPQITSAKDTQVDDAASKRVSVDLSWYQVHRELTLGPTWQVTTRVTRAHHGENSEVVIPLLKTERVLSSEHKVTPKGVRLSFSASEKSLEYVSELSIRGDFNLIAPHGVRWSEVWTLHCGVIWSCQYNGLNPIALGATDQPMSPRWRPWPRERVRVRVSQPKGVPGPVVTVQEMTYTFSPSATLARGEVSLTLNASRGSFRVLKLPQGASEVNLFIEGKQQFDPMRSGEVRLPIRPGKNKYKITWSQPWERVAEEEIPRITLLKTSGGEPMEAVNFKQVFKTGSRWLLWARGPAWGPAILFWGQLIVALLLALLLGRRRWSPLGRFGWFLLLGGLTQLGALLWVFMICWFGAFKLRDLFGGQLKSKVLFNFIQIALIGLTIIFLGVLIASVYSNLLRNADMNVRGFESNSATLRWYADRFVGESPEVSVFSLSQWVWRSAMLGWSLWIAYSLIRWLKWAWLCLNKGGGWRKLINSAPAFGGPSGPQGVPRPMNQGPMNQGPMNQGPMNQGPMNQGPMNQGPINQGPMNQGPMNQGPQGSYSRPQGHPQVSVPSSTQPLPTPKDPPTET